MQPQQKQERPPYVKFEERPLEIKDAQGAISYKSVDYAIITPVGTKDVVEKVAADWFNQMLQLEKMERWDPMWTIRFKEMYAIWKKTNEVPIDGTPIINWPLLTKAQITLLKMVNILTVEDLAQATEEAVGRLGMGGRNLVQLAQNWITATGSGAADLAQKNLALTMTNAELVKKNLELSQRITALEGQLASRQGANEQTSTPSSALVDPLTLRARQNDAADADFDKIVQ